jgi:hypothetical protein
MSQHPARLAAALLTWAAAGCVTNADRPAPTAPDAPSSVPAPDSSARAPLPEPVSVTTPATPPTSGDAPQVVDLAAPTSIVRVEAEAPRYAPPDSLKKFRYAKPPVEKPAAKPVDAASARPVAPALGGAPAPALSTAPPQLASASVSAPPAAAPRAFVSEPPARTRAAADRPVPTIPAAAPQPAAEAPATDLPATTVATVTAQPEAPRYKLPDSLSHWGSGRKVPLYADPDAAPWQADATEPRLQNAAVSCTYKDEGGVRGKAMLLVDNHKLTRFTARIEMPNGGVCQFDSKKMAQRPFEQGIALESKGDECIVRMWEQKHRITIAAYSCHKQCSRGSFSYLWPIIMDTRVGTCY